MHHFRRVTDETFGLICAIVALVASLNNWHGIAQISSGLLVLFFFFRLIWGKEHIHKKKK